jgi:hypothetical protein
VWVVAGQDLFTALKCAARFYWKQNIQQRYTPGDWVVHGECFLISARRCSLTIF